MNTINKNNVESYFKNDVPFVTSHEIISEWSDNVEVEKHVSLCGDGSINEINLCLRVADFNTDLDMQVEITPKVAVRLAQILTDYANDLVSRYPDYFIERELMKHKNKNDDVKHDNND